jgi:hypothetical protein
VQVDEIVGLGLDAGRQGGRDPLGREAFAAREHVVHVGQVVEAGVQALQCLERRRVRDHHGHQRAAHRLGVEAPHHVLERADAAVLVAVRRGIHPHDGPGAASRHDRHR